MFMSTAYGTKGHSNAIEVIAMGHCETESLLKIMLRACDQIDQERLLIGVSQLRLYGQRLYDTMMTYAIDRKMISPTLPETEDLDPLVHIERQVQSEKVIEGLRDSIVEGKLGDFVSEMKRKRGVFH